MKKFLAASYGSFGSIIPFSSARFIYHAPGGWEMSAEREREAKKTPDQKRAEALAAAADYAIFQEGVAANKAFAERMASMGLVQKEQKIRPRDDDNINVTENSHTGSITANGNARVNVGTSRWE